jgi:hypothetical protein
VGKARPSGDIRCRTEPKALSLLLHFFGFVSVNQDITEYLRRGRKFLLVPHALLEVVCISGVCDSRQRQ